VAHGQEVQRIANARSFDVAASLILYRTGRQRDAERLSRMLPVGVPTLSDDSMAEDVRVLLGRDLLPFDRDLVASANREQTGD
jgi:hypothetical protein